MGILNLFDSNEHRNCVAHFSAIVNIAKTDGAIDIEERKIIKQFARKLDIREDEYQDVMKNSQNYQILPVTNKEERLEHIYDLMKVIISDGKVDNDEKKLVLNYAVLLGVPTNEVEKLIDNSIKIFSGNLDFEEYLKVLKFL